MNTHRTVKQLALLTIVFATMFALVQQLNRFQANSMPELLATQTAKQLDAGYGLASINMGATDIANSPVPFVIVYDKKGKPVAGSGYLDKKLASMPTGVVQHAKPHKPHAVTWAPRSGVRLASVTVAAKEYYVVGGQSLRLTESHTQRLLKLALVGYSICVAVVLLAQICHCRRCQSQRCDCTHGEREKSAAQSMPPAHRPKKVARKAALSGTKPSARE